MTSTTIHPFGLDADGVGRFGAPKRALPALAVAVVLCYAAAAIGGAATTPQIPTWYAGLQKPSFNPPNWIFGPVWSILFTMMAVLLWQVWRAVPLDPRAAGQRRRALVAFAVQLVANVAWSVVFFGLRQPGLAIAVIAVLLGSIVWTMVAARPVAGRWVWLFAPYVAWVSFASVLNVAIVALNGPSP